MRIILFASGDFAIPTIQSLTDPDHGEHQVVCVVTQPDRSAGRGKKAKPTPVKAEAINLGLDVIATDNVNRPELIDRLKTYNAELGLVIAFGQKISSEVRELFRHQCINLHASLLPEYRGAAPFQRAIMDGREKVGVTTFRLVDRMDAGPVYVQRWTLTKPEERACELHDRLARVGVDAVNATLQQLQSDPPQEPEPQDDSLATLAPKLKKEDGYLRFTDNADQLANTINGLWSWPGAKCEFVSGETGNPERVTLAMARAADDCAEVKEEPGVLDYRLYVATGKGYLEILEIQPAGKRAMSFQDFVNGRHAKPGDRFITIEMA